MIELTFYFIFLFTFLSACKSLMMSTKRTRVMIKIEKKLEAINRNGKGELLHTVATDLNVRTMTVNDWMK